MGCKLNPFLIDNICLGQENNQMELEGNYEFSNTKAMTPIKVPYQVKKKEKKRKAQEPSSKFQ